MASDDGLKRESSKKRVTMSTNDKKLAPLKKIREPKNDADANDADVHANASGEDDAAALQAFQVGMVVSVRSSSGDKKQMRAATVVRVHRSGDLSVQYDSSDEVEKNVPRSRVQRSDDASSSQPLAAGDSVLYRLATSDSSDALAWRDGTVKACRRDGAFDIVDAATHDVVRKVAKSAVRRQQQQQQRKSKSRSSSDSAASDEDDDNDGTLLLAADAPVEYCDERGAWRTAHVHRMRSDGSVDVAVDRTSDSDDDSTERIVKRVARKRIRKLEAAKQTQRNNEGAPTGKHKAATMRQRRALAKTKRLRDQSASGNSDSNSDDNTNTNTNTNHARLRVDQRVQFMDTSGRFHRGRIRLVRTADATCDIAHDSDRATISKRIALDTVRPLSTVASLLTRPSWLFPLSDPRVFALNARVLYKTKDTTERKAVVVKVYRMDNTSTGPQYDIEDIVDGTIIKRIAGTKLRLVPWVNYSLPTLHVGPWPSLSSLFHTIPRKGMRVRFQLRNTRNTSRTTRNTNTTNNTNTWLDGVIVRAKANNTCVVEYEVADGSGETKAQATVDNCDIHTRFFTPFHLQNPLKDLLPTLELPRTLYPNDSRVEVVNGSAVHFGRVVSSNEQAQTYVIAYADGRHEKHVASDRVRLSLRQLRIGTEVEMIVEGPCHEVSRLDGEVAWVHRDERVAVRINGGNNDVFAQVCSHALMVDGQPAFAAPLSSTWVELLGFYCNLLLETFVFAWLCFGFGVELSDLVQLVRVTASDRLEDAAFMAPLYAAQHVDWTACGQTPAWSNSTTDNSNSSESASSNSGIPYLLLPSHVIETERTWLLALFVLKAALTASCVGFAAQLLHSQVVALQDNFIDVREYERARVLRRHLSRVMGVALVVSYMTLLVFAALLNHFRAFCLLHKKDTIEFDVLALETNVFAGSYEVTTAAETSPVALLLALAGKTTLNLLRATALHALIFAFPVHHTAFAQRIVLLVPSIGVAALLGALGIAALHAFYDTHEHFSATDNRTSDRSDVTWSIVLVMTTLWLIASLFHVIAAAGRFASTHGSSSNSNTSCCGCCCTTNDSSSTTTNDIVPDDVLAQAERGEFGLQAKREVVLTKVEQLQTRLGVCQLSAVRIHALAVVHISAMALAIVAICRLRAFAHAQHTNAATFHLVACVLWIVMCLVASLVARALKQQDAAARELWSYLLDV